MPTFSFFRVSADPYSRALSVSGKPLCGLIFEFVASIALVCLALSCSQIARAACSPAAANNVNATCTGATIGQYGSGAETNGTVTVSPAATLTGLGVGGRVIFFGSLADVSNYGSITAAPAGNPGTNVTSYAVTAQFGSATVINYANGTINSTSAGSGAAYGVFAGTDATVSNRSNTSSISARAFTNQSYGVYSANSSTVSSNSGRIQAESNSASASGVFGGVVTVSATDLNSTISGKSNSASGFGLNATTSASVTSNSGTIRGDSTSGNGYGIYSTGGISVTSNALTGLIAGTSNSGGSRGIFARTDVSIASNAGTISGTSTGATGIGNAHGLRSQIGSVTAVNTGTINASTLSADAASASAIWAATFATVTNTGTNSEVSATTQGIGGAAYGIRSGTANLTINANEGTIYTRSASGGSYGGYNDGVGANIVVNNNSGSIYARSGSGITAGLYSVQGSVSVVSNAVNGKIFAESSNSAGNTTGLRAANSVTIGENKGDIYGSGGGTGSVFGVYAGTSASITNLSSGTISATNATGTGTAFGIRSNNAATTIDNGGAISASSKNGWSYGIYLVAGAESITNSGSISGGTVGIYTGAAVKTLSNYQGGDGTSAANRPLTYQGVLPTNYGLFVSSDTHFGQTSFINPTGSMAVVIDPASTLAVGTYTSVFQGVDSTSVTGGSGTSGLIKWSLSMTDLKTKRWDLVVSNNMIEANTVRNASAIGVTFLPIFTGGTLLVDSANTSYSTNFSLDNTASNTIDLGEKTATFTGVFSDKTEKGNLTFTGKGTAILTGLSTYTGSTTIADGSTLALQGTGSIAKSSQITNQGVFDLRGLKGDAAFGGNFAQSTNAKLAMRSNGASVQSLTVAGTAKLDGTLEIAAEPGTYKSGLYRLIDAQSITGKFSKFATNLGDYVRTYWLVYQASALDLELIMGPDAVNSKQSLLDNTSALSALMKERSLWLSDLLQQECSASVLAPTCMAIQGRFGNTAMGHEGSGLINAAWQLSDTVRAGGFIDQGSVSARNTGVQFSSSEPTWGAFVRWNENADGSGLQARLGFAAHEGAVTMVRPEELANTEAGVGNAKLESHALGLELSWGIPWGAFTMLIPYLGVQDTRSRRSGYVEGTSAAVTYPVTFQTFDQNVQSSTLGLRMRGMASDRLHYQWGAGLEYKERRYGTTLSGSSDIYGLENFAFDVRDTSPSPDFVGSIDLRYQRGQGQAFTFGLAMRGPVSEEPHIFKATLGYQIAF